MKRVLFPLGILLVNLFIIEIAATVAAFLIPNLFNTPDAERTAWLTNFDDYQAFLERGFDPVTGWNTPSNESSRRDNCLGESITYSFGPHGARVTPVPGRARILIVGDSYAFGQEVGDADTYPSRLAELLDVPVANYGVGGFGPTQALLRLKQKLSLHPEAEVVILSIMYENVRRMRNAYRPAYHATTGTQFGFKPYVKITQSPSGSGALTASIEPNPNAIPAATPEALRARVDELLRSDYWTTARRRFPFSLSLTRTLRREAVRLRVAGSLSADSGKYAREFRHPEFQAGLLEIARQLVSLAEARGLERHIVFVPQNSKGLATPDETIRLIDREVEPGLAVNVGGMRFDWSRYNLKPDSCHPTPAGHWAIAAFVAERLTRDR